MNEKQIPWKLISQSFKCELSEFENHELNEWLSNPVHHEIYKELQQLWNRLMEEGANYTSNADYLWSQMQKRMHPMVKPVVKKSSSIQYHRWLSIAASIIIIISIGFTCYWLYSWNEINRFSQHFAAINGKSFIELPDGSTVWLNKGSELTYSSSPFSIERQVELKGEAFFNVAKNSSRPFIVDCSDIEIKVLGTSFNVDAPTDDQMAVVSLMNGSVSITTPNNKQIMIPGEKAFYDKSTGTLKIEEADTSIESLWAAEKMVISQKNIRETVAYLEQWFDVSISVSSKIKNEQSYTLVVNKEDTIEDILETLAQISKLKYNFIDKNNIEIVKP